MFRSVIDLPIDHNGETTLFEKKKLNCELGRLGYYDIIFPGNEEDAYSTKVKKHGRYVFEVLEILQFYFQLSGLKLITLALNYRL